MVWEIFNKSRFLAFFIILFTTLISACNMDQVPSNIDDIIPNSNLYNFCIQNNGTVINSTPKQCNYQKLVYFQSTENAINVQFCKGYYDGCNACQVHNGSVIGCTDNVCTQEGTPRCLEFDQSYPSGSGEPLLVEFQCQNESISVVFDNKDQLMNLSYGNEVYLLSQMVSASGSKYSNQQITFFTKRDQAMLLDAENESRYLLQNCTVI